jgi:hypothetical protein
VQRSRRRSPQEKAVFHQVTGAGKARVKREFLGLTEAELKQLDARLEGRIRVKLEGP